MISNLKFFFLLGNILLYLISIESYPILSFDDDLEISNGSLKTIFECDFDESLICGAELKTTNAPHVQSVSNYHLSPLLQITDITSITKPTSNGEKCIIPFLSGSTQHYHCTLDADECLTDSGQMSKCVLGNFFYCQSPSAFNSQYTASLKFPTIDLPSESNNYYLIRFYSLFVCDNGCAVAQDKMSLRITDTNQEILLEKDYFQKDFRMESVWIKRELVFSITNLTKSSQQIILEFEFSRNDYFESPSLFAIDNIELIEIDENNITEFSNLTTDDNKQATEFVVTTELVIQETTTTYINAQNNQTQDATTIIDTTYELTNLTTTGNEETTTFGVAEETSTSNGSVVELTTSDLAVNSTTPDLAVSSTTPDLAVSSTIPDLAVNSTIPDLAVNLTTIDPIDTTKLFESDSSTKKQSTNPTSSSSSSSSSESSTTTKKNGNILIETTPTVVYVVIGVLGLIVVLLIIVIVIVCVKKSSSSSRKVAPESFNMKKRMRMSSDSD